MISICEKILTALKKHTFYYRIMVPFSVLSIVIVLVTAMFSWHVINERYETEIKNSNANILTQIKIYTDQSVYESIMSIINNNFLNLTSSSELEQFFTYGKKLQTSKILSVYRSMGDICSSNPYIKNVALYHKTDDLLLDAGYGLCYDASEHLDLLDKSIPFSVYNNASSDSLNKYIYLTPENGLEHSDYSLTLLRAIPLYSGFDKNDGYIAISVDKEQLLADIKYKYSLQGGLFILDEDGLLLLEAPQGDMNYEKLRQISVTESQILYNVFPYGGKEYCMITLQSEISGWIYRYCLPLDVLNADSIADRQFVIMLVVLVILFAMIVIQIITDRIYRPLINLRKKVVPDHIWIDGTDDIMAMQNTFFFLESKIEDMQETFSKNKNFLQYKCLLDLLYGNNFSEDKINRQLQLSGIFFQESYYCLIVIEIEKVVFEKFSLEQEEYVKAKFQEYIADWFEKSVTQITESYMGNRIVALLNLSLLEYNKLLDDEQQFLDYLQDKMHVRINIAISECADSLSEISRLHISASNSLRYSFIYNYGNVFTHETITFFERNQMAISPKEIQEMEYWIRNDNIEKLMQTVDGYIAEIYENHYSYNSVNSFLMQIYSVVFRVGREWNVFEHNQDKKDKIILEFNHSTNLKQSIECIFMLLYVYRDIYHKKNDRGNVELIKNITDYIRQNCQAEITLASVAEYFHISAAHLSRLFKTIHGENFSTFVVNVKLEKAAQMLIEEKTMSVNEIAESLGYYVPAYFTRLFKGKYGVTPTAYRKKVYDKNN